MNRPTLASVGKKPEPYEITLARRLLSQKKSLLHIFLSIDGDEDGIIKKNDLKIALYNKYEMDLTDDQIGTIFLNCCGTKEGTSSHNHKCGMRYPDFARYIDKAANSMSISSNNLFTSSLVKASNGKSHMATTKSVSSRTRSLRRKVLNLIQQSAPSDLDGGMAATHMFLSMDKLRNNKVTQEEFQCWLGKKQGLVLNVEDMKLIMGEFWTEDENDGLSVRECVAFVQFLENNCVEDPTPIDERGDEDVTKESQLLLDSKIITGQRDEHENLGTGLVRMKISSGVNISEIEKEAIKKFRRSIDNSYLKTTFKSLARDNLTLNADELKRGFEQKQIEITDEQIENIMKYFGNENLEMEFFHFVKFITTKN